MTAAASAGLTHVTVVILVCVCPSNVSWAHGAAQANPTFSNRMQLVSSTGYYLTILPNAQVKGVDEDSNKYTVVDILSNGTDAVRLLGVESKLYLAMDDKGLLYGEEDPNVSATLFSPGIHNSHNTYQSKKHSWYVGIRKNGMAKPGPLTKLGQRAAHFIPKRKFSIK